MSKIEFMECAECAAKPGSPTLCKACIHNKYAIEALQTPAARTTKPPEENGEYWVQIVGWAKPVICHAAIVGDIWEFWTAAIEDSFYMGAIEWRSIDPVTEPEWGPIDG